MIGQGWYRLEGLYGTQKAHFYNKGYPLCGNAHLVKTPNHIDRGPLTPYTGSETGKCKSCVKHHKSFKWVDWYSAEGTKILGEALAEGVSHCLVGNVKKG